VPRDFRLPALLGAASTSLVLGLGCGGGSSSHSSTAVSLALVSPAQIQATLAQAGQVPDQTLEVQASGDLNRLAGQTIYAEVVDPDSLFVHGPLTVSAGAAPGTFSANLAGQVLANAGHYTGTIEILVATDPTFTNQLAVPPLALPFDVTVTATSTRSVGGNSMIAYQTLDAATGVMSGGAGVPNPLSSTAVKAVEADGTTVLQGSYDTLNGDYSILEVPSGYYWLQVGSDYIWTSSSSVSLSWQQAGRAVTLDTTAVDATFDVTRMTPWASNDYLLCYDYNSGLHVNWNTGTAGTTSQTMTIPWLGLPLVDTTQGDAPQVIQYVDSVQGTSTVHTSTPTNAYSWSGTMTNGQSSTFYPVLAPIALTDTVPVYFQRSAFASYRSQYNPAYILGWGPFMEADSLAGASAIGAADSWLDGVTWQDSNNGNVGDVALGDIPAPVLAPGCQRIYYAGETHYLVLTAPGAVAMAFPVRGIRSYTLTPPTSGSPLQPLVSPVKSPIINGVSPLVLPQTVAGLTPSIAWTAPDLPSPGTPDEYEVLVYQVGADAGLTTATQVARLYLPGTQTSLVLPSGILAHGQTYVFLIRSYVDSTSAPSTAPFYYHKFPYGLAESLSAMITFS
jgi:hypothetical protein